MNNLVEMRPIIDAFALEDAINAKYDAGITDILSLMFYDDYHNDIYKSFYFGNTYGHRDCSNERECQLDIVRSFLKELLPNEDSVLICISW